MKKFNLLLLMLLSLWAFSACSDDDDSSSGGGGTPPDPETETIADVLKSDPEFSTLVAALDSAGLLAALDDPDVDYTLFAPDNEAFEALLEDEEVGIDELGDITPEMLADVLKFHVVDGTYLAEDLTDGQELTTLQGGVVTVSISNDSVYVDSVLVKAPDYAVPDNGVIHTIAEVLLPPPSLWQEIAMDEDFSILAEAIMAAGLVDLLSNPDSVLTIFAPNNAAFEALLEPEIGFESLDAVLTDTLVLKAILFYHMTEGAVYSADLTDGMEVENLIGTTLTIGVTDVVTVNGVTVIEADREATNGVMHVVEEVLFPEPFSIADVLASNENFTTLVEALTKADLLSAFEDLDASYTLFAPTNDAFQAVWDADNGIGSLDDLTAEQLVDILTYHAAEGAVLSKDLTDGQEVPTLLEGQSVLIGVSDTGVTVNEANVTLADVPSYNGVVHVIDAVLIPVEEPPVDPEPASTK